jgi:hypothetical protein
VLSVERHRSLPQTLLHADVHLKNWYIAANGEMGLGDWQNVCRGHWGRDVAYAMATALSVEDRRRWEEDLLKYYLESLRQAGGPAVAFDSAWDTYRLQLFAALAYWTVTLVPNPEMPDMQPEETSRAFIRRIATAIDDLGALGVAK